MEKISDLLKGVNDAIVESVILETQVQMVGNTITTMRS